MVKAEGVRLLVPDLVTLPGPEITPISVAEPEGIARARGLAPAVVRGVALVLPAGSVAVVWARGLGAATASRRPRAMRKRSTRVARRERRRSGVVIGVQHWGRSQSPWHAGCDERCRCRDECTGKGAGRAGGNLTSRSTLSAE